MKKSVFRLLYFVIVVYTLLTLIPIDKTGGPCNQGIVFVIIGPLIIVVTIIQYLAYYRLTNKQIEKKFFYQFMSLCCCAIWTLFFYLFASDHLLYAILYLTPFLVLNITVLIITFRPKLIIGNNPK